MATSIGSCALVLLPGEPASLTEKPGRPWSASSQRVGRDQSDPAHVDARLLLPVVALPQWELSVKVLQLLGFWGSWRHQVCRDTGCLCHRSYGPIRVFFQASCSWRSEGLFDLSFSIAPPVQALRGLPCLGSISVVQCLRHLEGSPWLGSCSVAQCIRRWMGLPLLFSCQCCCVGRERLWWWLHPSLVTQQWSEVAQLCPYGLFATPWTVAYQAPQSMEYFRQEYWSGLPFPYCLASMAFMLLWQLSSTGISHQSPPWHPLDLSLHSQQQSLPWDCSTIPKLQLPATVLFRGHASLSRVCMAAARTVWFSFHLACHNQLFQCQP